MKVYDVTVFTDVLTKEQIQHAVDSFLSDYNASGVDIVINTQSYSFQLITDKEFDMRGHAISIASYVQTFDPKAYVRVRDLRFKDTRHGIRWVNDGVTVYSDSSVYEDPAYEFHYNDRDDYEILYIPTYAAKFCPRDKERYEKTGAKYMWRCTACWDNFMEAETIEDAIEEFEEMYREQLWNSVVSEQESLRRATDRFREFDEYRRTK
jgi:hypothetical protein